LITAQQILEELSGIKSASSVGSDTKKTPKKTVEKTKSILPAAKPIAKSSGSVPTTTSTEKSV
jgi:hypothetical protein